MSLGVKGLKELNVIHLYWFIGLDFKCHPWHASLQPVAVSNFQRTVKFRASVISKALPLRCFTYYNQATVRADEAELRVKELEKEVDDLEGNGGDVDIKLLGRRRVHIERVETSGGCQIPLGILHIGCKKQCWTDLCYILLINCVRGPYRKV